MFSKSFSNCVKQSSKKSSTAVKSSLSSSLRFASSKSDPFNKQFQTSFANFIKTAKLDKEGNFIKEQSSESDFQNSSLNKFVIKSIKERDELIEKKLKELATENNVKFEDLKSKFDAKVKENLQSIQNQNNQIYSTITDFTHTLKSSFDNNTFWNQLIDGLFPYADNLHNSKAFQYIKSIDSDFADSLSNIITRIPTEQSVKIFANAFENGPISKISESQFGQLKHLLADTTEIVSSSKNDDLAILEQDFDDVDGETVMSTIFASLNMYEDINKAPLLRFINDVDPSFAKLLIDYSKIDSENEQLLEESLQKIIQYCSNKESVIYKAFGDPASPDFLKIKEILEQPLPIDLGEIYEIFENYPDYFTCDAFKTIENIDPKFAQLLKELESVPEGKELDEKNQEVDNYLANSETAINIAMNDVESSAFNELRNALNKEWDNLDSTVSPDKIIEYIANNGIDSDGFKLIAKIDDNFSILLKEFYSEQENEKAMEIYNKIQKYLDEPNLINAALNDKESLNYKLLFETFIPKIEAIEEELQNSYETNLKEVEDIENKELLKEDQSNLSPEVVEMNKMYDLTIEVIDELQKELENNTFIQPSRSIEASLDQLLGFQPSKEQIDSAKDLKELPTPKHTDEVLELCVNIIMKNGKKEVARKNLNRTLYLLFLETRKNPVQLLKDALDMAAPLVITKTVKTGFAKNFTVPVPLTQRQRDRMALKWILTSCDSKASNDFPVRLCEEILFVLTGKSKLMDKRVLSHKMAIANRSYLKI